MYVESFYVTAFQVKIFVSMADPSRFVIEKAKSVGQLAVKSVELTNLFEKVYTFSASSMMYV